MGTPLKPALVASVAFLALSACDRPIDLDFRDLSDAFDTTDAVQRAVSERPRPDNRGIISYPNYQVVVAQRNDTVAAIAGRLALDAGQLARYNGIEPDVRLRRGEIIALPNRVAEPSPATGAIGVGPIRPPEQIDVQSLASSAIDNAEAQQAPAPDPATQPQTGLEPTRHKVERGETAYSIARRYDVPVRALADWNALDRNLTIREGQFLLIPVPDAEPPARPVTGIGTTEPGEGSPTPTPPSASQPLPQEVTPVAAPAPAAPDLGPATQAAPSNARMARPADGAIIRTFAKGRSEGIDISTTPGAPIRAAADGTVAAITQDTDKTTIVVVRHPDNLLTVYANVDGVRVQKGASVRKGQTIAAASKGDPSFLHFEVRNGFDAVDPEDFIN